MWPDPRKILRNLKEKRRDSLSRRHKRKAIGLSLHTYRMLSEMTLQETADHLGIHYVRMDGIERGRETVTDQELDQLLYLYGVRRNTFREDVKRILLRIGKLNMSLWNITGKLGDPKRGVTTNAVLREAESIAETPHQVVFVDDVVVIDYLVKRERVHFASRVAYMFLVDEEVQWTEEADEVFCEFGSPGEDKIFLDKMDAEEALAIMDGDKYDDVIPYRWDEDEDDFVQIDWEDFYQEAGKRDE